MKQVRLFVVAALSVIVPVAALAQAETSVIAGTVRDASGGAIPGATVRIVNEKTRAAVETVSDPQGAYRVASLAPGAYRLETTLDGFEPAVRQISLEGGRTAEVELTLMPARLSEGVVVTARRVEQVAQEVPIPLSVVDRKVVENAGARNKDRRRGDSCSRRRRRQRRRACSMATATTSSFATAIPVPPSSDRWNSR